MIINFECRKCKKIFDCDVGEVSVPGDSERPHFENTITCPCCGPRTMDEVYLTELGQSQLTEITLKLESIDVEELYFKNGDFAAFDSSSGECLGCDTFQTLDDLGLCRECSAKLDRDLIRQRHWENSITAYVTPESERENLRNHVIKTYGEPLELIAPEGNNRPKKRKKKRKKTIKNKTTGKKA
jgi:hypothetical protein